MSIADEPVMAKPPEESNLAKNLRRLMAERGLNARGLLRKAGIPKSTVISEVFSGKTRMPNFSTLELLARGLDVDIPSLVGPPGISRASSFPIHTQIPVVAMAETGVLRTKQDIAVLRAISSQIYRDFPPEQHFALEIRDIAMDAATRSPLSPGSFALCIDVVRAKLIVESGKIYAIRRWRQIDGQRHEEILIRRAQVFSDRVELTAESRRPDRFERIVVPGTLSTNPDDATHAFGLVYSCTGFCYDD